MELNISQCHREVNGLERFGSPMMITILMHHKACYSNLVMIFMFSYCMLNMNIITVPVAIAQSKLYQ